MESIKELLNMLGVVNALILNIAVSFLSARNYEDMISADERYMTKYLDDGSINGYYRSFKSYERQKLFGSAPSVKMSYNSYLAVALQAGALIIVIVCYLDVLTKSFDASTSKRSLRIF